MLLLSVVLAAACEGDARTADDDDDDSGPCTTQCMATPCCDGTTCYHDYGPGHACFTEVCECVGGQWDCRCGTSCSNECSGGETRPCTCPDGTPSVQECWEGMCANWSPCLCDGSGGAGGEAGSGGAAGAGMGGIVPSGSGGAGGAGAGGGSAGAGG